MNTHTPSQREAFGQLSGRDERVLAKRALAAEAQAEICRVRELIASERAYQRTLRRYMAVIVGCCAFLVGYVAGGVL